MVLSPPALAISAVASSAIRLGAVSADGVAFAMLPPMVALVKVNAAEAFGVRLHSFDAAVERALRDWEQTEEVAAK